MDRQIETYQEAQYNTDRALRPPDFDAVWFADAIRDCPQQKWLVHKIIPDDSLVVIYGQHGTAKTFLTMDLAAHIASGAAWRNYRVERCGVIYVAAEGRAGLRKRLTAWSQEYSTHDALPLVMMTKRVNLLDDAETAVFIVACKLFAGDMHSMGHPLGLLVFDTLARCIARGDENKDMGILVDNAEKIRKALGNVTCVFVHHSGKDPARGARGHTSLPAAADTMIELTKDDGRLLTARVGKQKDEEDGVRLHFRLKRVSLGYNDLGEEESSCVVVESELETKPTKGPVLKGDQKLAWNTLTQTLLSYGSRPATTLVPAGLSAVEGSKWRAECYRGWLSLIEDENLKKRRFDNAARDLMAKGMVGCSTPWVWQAR